MSVLEVGHESWERHDADRVAWALLDGSSCVSVRLVPPGQDCAGWSVCATYEDPPLPRLFPHRARTGGRR